jgi:hypothetical protein
MRVNISRPPATIANAIRALFLDPDSSFLAGVVVTTTSA